MREPRATALRPAKSGEHGENAEPAASHQPPQSVPQAFPRQQPAPGGIIPGGGYVYFFRDEATGLVKIGMTSNPVRRFCQIRSEVGEGLDYTCAVEVPGPAFLERMLHIHFKHLREHGEWFREGDRLSALIEEVRDTRSFDRFFREAFAAMEDARKQKAAADKAAARAARPKGNSRKAGLAAYKAARGLS